MSKENVYFGFMKRLQADDQIDVRYNDWTDVTDVDSVDDEDVTEYPPENSDPISQKLMIKLLRKYKEEFENYCKQAVCIGFNSGKYDINLLRKTLIKHLGLHLKSGHKCVIKRNNNYQCIVNDKLKFLDMVNYLPPGTSYSQFLETFNQKENKAFFPYEYMSDISVLQETSLPPPQAFYSSLKQQNVLENEVFAKYCLLVEEEDKEIEEALEILNLEKPPMSELDSNYAKVLQIWERENMTTF